MRAIVIDDSRAMRGIIKRALRGLGFDCIEAADGADALRVLAEQPAPPALAMVDWNMPNMTGIEFVKTIRQDARFADMRIVMVTTEVEMDRVVAALEAGANEYLMKPFTPEALTEKVGMLELNSYKAAS